MHLDSIDAVIMAPGHSPSQATAATELARHIEAVTGKRVATRVDGGPLPPDCIVLGDHPGLRDCFPPIDFAALGDDGYRLIVAGGRVAIAGSRVRGTLYGAYDFLERVLGIAFLAPEIVDIPPRDGPVVVGDMDVTEMPAFPYRVITNLDGLDPEFSATQRINLNPFAGEETGGSHKFSPGKMTHTFYALVPPAKHFKDHPAYFSLVGGKRLENLGQLCLTNPDVVRIATDTVMGWFEEEPDLMTVGIVQNDWTNYCECDACKAVDRGNPARSLLRFCAAIAGAVRDRFPGKFVHTIAYTYTETPPLDCKGIVPENMIVVACNMYPYRSNRPIDGDPLNERYHKNLEGWLAIAPHVFVWHYFVDFTHYLLPYPTWATIAADLRKYKAMGVEGVLLQAGIGLGLYQEFQELKMWVFHKLLWNPDLDLDGLVRTFVRRYYKDGAPAVQAMVDDMARIEARDNVHLHLYVGLEGGHVSRDWVVATAARVQAAIDGCADPATRERLARVLVCLDYAYLLLPATPVLLLGKLTTAGAAERRAVLDRFKAAVARFKITSHGESVPIAGFLARQELLAGEHDALAIAELAPLVTRVLETLLENVRGHATPAGHFVPNDFITSVLALGLNPIDLSHWMSSKGIARLEPGVPDNWHAWLDPAAVEAFLHPPVPRVRKGDLPSVVLGMIKGLPKQKDVLDD